jgi:hypothetical protein
MFHAGCKFVSSGQAWVELYAANDEAPFVYSPVSYKHCYFKGKVHTEDGFLRNQFVGADFSGVTDRTPAIRLERVVFEPLDAVAVGVNISGNEEGRAYLEAAQKTVFTDATVVAKFGFADESTLPVKEVQIMPNLKDAASAPVPFLTLKHPFYQRYLTETVRYLWLRVIVRGFVATQWKKNQVCPRKTPLLIAFFCSIKQIYH